MTDTDPLPTVITCTTAFTKRLPTQRLLDQLAHLEPGATFADLAAAQPFRIIAFRILVRDYPGRDQASLWGHAYDCEVDVADDDPFDMRSLGPVPPSVITGNAGPAT
ncbi:MAG TPA: hypothetical protein VGH66_12490 [Acidimicrobiales bacterium]|jgi:hypothetical protein